MNSNGNGPFVGGAHHEANVAHSDEVVVNGGFKGEEEWTEERLRHNFLKRNEEKRRQEDERQRENGAVGEKVARALGYPNEGEMSLRVAEVSIERKEARRRRGVDIMLKQPPNLP